MDKFGCDSAKEHYWRLEGDSKRWFWGGTAATIMLLCDWLAGPNGPRGPKRACPPPGICPNSRLPVRHRAGTEQNMCCWIMQYCRKCSDYFVQTRYIGERRLKIRNSSHYIQNWTLKHRELSSTISGTSPRCDTRWQLVNTRGAQCVRHPLHQDCYSDEDARLFSLWEGDGGL